MKKSFTLHDDVVQAAVAAVREGAAENLSAFVEQAIEEKLRRANRARLYDAYAEAAQDPAFMADMRDVATDFDAAVNDGLRDA